MPDDYEDIISAAIPKTPKPSKRIVHQPDGTNWSLDRLGEVESAYQTTFKKRLPLVNRGQGSIHNKWGYDHRNSADVSINPSSPEGQRFTEELKRLNVPFLAFSEAIPGVATGPHYHLGLPSKKTGARYNVGAQARQKQTATDSYGDVIKAALPKQQTPATNYDDIVVAAAKPKLEVGGKVGGPQASTGIGELRRIDERDLQQMTRIRKQVESEPTAGRRVLTRAAGAPGFGQLPTPTVDEEVLRRISAERDVEKRQADALAEQDRLIKQFTDADRKEISDFVNHLQGKGKVYTGVRTGIRSGGSRALYKLAGLADIGNQVAKRTVGESWIPDYLRKKALAGEMSVDDIPQEKRNQIAEFLAETGVGLAELGAAPGSITTKFAGLSGSEAIGRNLPAEEVARETGKGAAMGVVQKYGEALAPATASFKRRLATTAPAVGLGSGAVELATGATPREALLSTVTNAAFQGVGELRRGRRTTTSVPERPETVGAQLDAVAQGTRPAVLFTEGTPRPTRPKGLDAIRTQEGVFYFDPKQVTGETLQQKVADGTYGELLGHVEPKSEATTEAVVARDAEGNEVQASAVSPENVTRQAEVLQQQYPDATVRPELAEDVIAERLADREAKVSPTFLRDDAGNPVARVLNPEEVAQGAKPKVRPIHQADTQVRDDGGRFAEKTETKPAEQPAVAPEPLPTEVAQPVRAETTASTPDRPTSIKNAATEELRRDLDLEEMTRPEKKSWQTAIDNAQSKDLDANKIADEVVAGDREVGLDYEQSAAVLVKLRELENQWESAYRKDSKSQEVSDLKAQIDKLSKAVDMGGTEPARALNFRRAMMNKDFKLINLVRAAEKGRERPVTAKELSRYDSIIKERDTAIAERDALLARSKGAPLLDKFVKEQRLEVRRQGRARKQSDLLTERAELKQQLSQAWAKTRSDVQPSGLAGLDPEGEMTRLLTKLARNYIEGGVIKATDLVDVIHNDIKDVVDISKREVSDLISGYGRIRKPTFDKVEQKLNEIKSILAATSGKADVVEKAMRPLRRGQQREKPTEDQRRALRELNDAMRERGPELARESYDVETQQATPLDKVKTTARNRIEQLEKWLADGKRETPSGARIVPDAELTQLRSEKAALERVARLLDDPAADQKAIERRLNELNRSIIETRKKTQSGNVEAKPKEGANSLWSQEIGALEKERVALRQIANDMRTEATRKAREAKKVAAKNPASFYGAEMSWADFESQARRSLNRVKQLDKRVTEYERRVTESDFEPKAKKAPPTYNADVKRAEDRVAAAESRYRREMERVQPGYWGRKVVDTLNVAKTLKSSVDLSAPRQAAMWMINHPVQGTNLFFGKQLRAMKGKNFDEFVRELESDPDYQLMRRAELSLTTPEKDAPLASREEAFMSKLAGKIPGVKYSERAYTTFLDTARVSWFKQLKGAAEAKAKTEARTLNDKDYKAIANFINISTGRGNLGKGKLNQVSPVLNALFFAPKYAASKVQVFDPRVYKRLPAGARKIAMREAAVHFGAMTTTALLLKYGLGIQVGLNPEEAEFMKARVGNTRYDLSNGTGQYVTLAARLMRNASNKATGEKDVYGRSISQNIDRFLRYKYSPPPAFVRNMWEGKNPIGKETSLTKEAVQLIAPLFVNEMIEAFQVEGLTGMAKTTPSFVGVGTSTYPDRVPSPSQRRSSFIERLRKGSISTDQLQDEVDKGGITEADRKAIEQYGSMTPKQEVFSKAPPATALDRYERMNATQRSEVEEIMLKKAKSLDTSDSLTEAQKEAFRTRLYKLGIVP